MVASNSPDWLPSGWTVEVKVRNYGRKDKCYIDPASGCKFYSKPEVSRYLETVNAGRVGQKKTGASSVTKRDVNGVTKGKSSSTTDASQNYKTTRSKSCISKEEKSGIGKPSIDNVVTESGTPDELPTGWIKEIKARKSMNRIRKYTYYTDPVSGYVFSSKKDALRYVETGDIDSCVVKPKKRDMNDQELTGGNNPVAQKNDRSTKGKSFSKPNESPNGKAIIIKSGIDKQGKVVLGEPSTNNKNDRSTKGKSSSKLDESPNAKAIKNKSGIYKQEKVVLGEPSTNNVVIEKDSPDELPPGWIKEIKTKKSGKGVSKYTLYTDPLSGYVFSSKKDALRYLETGNIDSCASKPKKRDTDDPELINGKISVIIHSLTGGESFSKMDMHQNGDTIKSKSGTSKQEIVDTAKPSIDKVVNESGSAEELPPGWRKEIKTKKSVNGLRKYTSYMDPSTGYVFSSKKDALRFVETGDIDNCAVKPKKNASISIDQKTDEVPEWLPSGWTVELKSKNSNPPTTYKCYVDTKSGRKFYSKPEVFRYLETVNSGSVGLKNKGIGSISNDHLTGAMPDTSHDCKPIESKSCTSEKKKVGIDKHLINNVAIERGSTDKLPPGWIKEIRTRKMMNGIRRDPYYTDPVSGYEFRSLKDALRYLETGDINTCAIKPRKRGMNDPELINGNISSPSAVEARESSHCTTRRQLSAGAKSSASGIHQEKHVLDDANESSDSKTKGSKRKRGTEISAENTYVSTPATDKGSKRTRGTKVSAENSSISIPATTPVSKRTRGMKVSAENASIAIPATSPVSKRKRGMEVSLENVSVPTPTAIVHMEKMPENVIPKNRNRKTQVDLSNPKNKRALPMSPPSRTSKRLAGINPETPINLGLSELGTSDAPQSATQVLGGEPEVDIAPYAELIKEIMLNVELPNQREKSLEEQQTEKLIEDQTVTDEQTKKPLEGQAVTEERTEKHIEDQTVANEQTEEQQEKPLENQAVTDEQTEKPQEDQAVTDEQTEKPQEDQAKVEEQQEKPVEEKVVVEEEQPSESHFYPMMDSWSDPCIEFAFKTLTGAIPVEDNMGVEGYLQQQVEPSHTHNDGDLASFPVSGLPNYFQNHVSSNTSASEKPGLGSTQQCPENPTFMPSCVNDGTQSSSLSGKQRM
ncbi:hypothetical protein LguiB_034652 [Lonicera macranthoides]